MRSVLPSLLYSLWAFGQSTQKVPAPPPVYGAASGHVTCTDTNQPARLASVTLQSINVKPAPNPLTPLTQSDLTRTYQTSLDGSFFIPKVPSGTYYVVVQVPGYLSPIKQFSMAELEHPATEVLARILKAVPTVNVEANRTAAIDIRLERGGELTGAIRYDDGSPVPDTDVTALTREAEAGKEAWVTRGMHAKTDDRGYFRFTGLPAGEYLLQVSLSLYDRFVSNVLDDSYSISTMGKYGLTFYLGDVARKDKGKPVKLGVGEQRDGADLTIPVGKLHRVAGTLVERGSGRVINAGNVALKFTDGTELVNTKIDPEDGTFHFDFVPEGEYTLFVTNAREIIREPMPIVPYAITLPDMFKETSIRAYGDTSQPLIVQSDGSGLTVPVSPKTAKAPATAQ